MDESVKFWDHKVKVEGQGQVRVNVLLMLPVVSRPILQLWCNKTVNELYREGLTLFQAFLPLSTLHHHHHHHQKHL